MRVISGSARGLKLQSLDGLATRPTTDKVKEAIFSMIFASVPSSMVLDLFAGSGAMGIEALSRGAKGCDFVDIASDALGVAKANAEKARLSGGASFFNLDADTFLKRAADSKKSYDLIFLDPPYSLGVLGKTIAAILEYGLLSDGGYIIMEFDEGTEIDISGYNLVKEKKYGRVFVNILEALR